MALMTMKSYQLLLSKIKTKKEELSILKEATGCWESPPLLLCKKQMELELLLSLEREATIASSPKGSRVRVGREVVVKIDEEEFIVHLEGDYFVQDEESVALQVSILSPVGKAINGLSEGDVSYAETGVREIKVEIVKILP